MSAPEPPTVLTIGVYEFDAKSFLATLESAGVRLVLDVRQRRGVRGPLYVWANSQRLQELLRGAGITYRHHLELAPTTEIRRLLSTLGVGQRSRTTLTPEYIERYRREILDQVDLDSLAEELRAQGPGALLCLEATPEACHRSLIAERLVSHHGFSVTHLLASGARSPDTP